MRSSSPSIAELRAACQPPGLIGRRSAEHWAGRAYMRRVSIFATWAAVRARASANAVTAVMVVVGIAGAAAVTHAGLGWAIVGAAVIQLYLLLDCVDGEVARWTGTSSAAGIYLDRLGHYVVEGALLVALGLRAGGWGDSRWLAWGLAAALVGLLVKVETDLVDLARQKHGLAPVPDSSDVASPRAGLLAAARRAAGLLPVYRLTGAIEASLAIMVAAAVDRAAGSIDATRALLLGMFAIAALTLVGHLAMILASSRLRA